MGASLINVFIDKLRVLSLRNLSVGFVATGLELGHISSVLSFEKVDDCEKFLKEIGCVISVSVDGTLKKMDCRASIVPLRKAPLKVRRSNKWLTIKNIQN